MLAAAVYERRQQPELALHELRTWLARAWHDPDGPSTPPDRSELAALFVRTATKTGRAEVRDEVDALMEEFSRDEQLCRLAAEYHGNVLREPERAAEYLAVAERLRSSAGR